MELINVEHPYYPVLATQDGLNSPKGIDDPFCLPRLRYEPSLDKANVGKSITAEASPVAKSMSENSQEICLLLGAEIYEELARLNPFKQGHGTPSSSVSGSPNSNFSQFSLGSPVGTSSDAWSSAKNGSLNALVPEGWNVPIKEGHQHRPALRECEGSGRTHSRMASFDYNEMHKQLSRVKVFEKIDELDVIDPNDEATFGPVGAHKKKLFGENGWLEATGDSKGLRPCKSTSKKLKNLGKKIKQHVEELAEDVTRTYPGTFLNASCSTKIIQKTTVPITLDLSTQAKLYSELEFMICSSANEFLLQQYYDGRISQGSIKKINSSWGSKNRPRVTEFHFDQTTQRELILVNLRTLRFHGECAINPVLLHSNLRNWKAIAKEMSVRTFCLPDSAIRKHLHDIYKLLEMLNAAMSTLEAFHALHVRVQDDIIKRMKMSQPRSIVSISY